MESTGPTFNVSRRRVIQGAAWAAPAILIATAAPAAASSGPSQVPGEGAALVGVLVINNLTLSNISAPGGGATYNFKVQYLVYNDDAGFTNAGIQTYQALEDPSFSSWYFTWLLEFMDAQGRVLKSYTGNETLTHSADKLIVGEENFGAAGTYTARLVVTSGKVATARGLSFMAKTVSATKTEIVT